MPAKVETTASPFASMTPDAFMKAFPFGDMSKDAMSASTESAKVSVKGFQDASAMVLSQARERMSATVESGKALAGAKTVEEAMSIQSDFFQSSMKAHVDSLSELTTLYTNTMKEAFAPFAAQAKAAAEKTKAS